MSPLPKWTAELQEHGAGLIKAAKGLGPTDGAIESNAAGSMAYSGQADEVNNLR